MTVKLTGAEFNAFMADAAVWPEGAWYEDCEAYVNGVADDLDRNFDDEGHWLPAEAEIKIAGGMFFAYANQPSHETISFETVLKRWLKARSVCVLMIEVPNTAAAIEAVVDFVEGMAGARVVKQPKVTHA